MAAARTGLLLFAHGSRDPRWAEPFERLRDRLAAGGVLVELGYLELMQPDLEAAARALVARGAAALRVVPVFLGEGSHVRRDLPQRAAAASAALGIPVALSPAVGESEDVLEALALYCVAELARP